jgi:Ca2+-binding RTX toxin-like protein
VNDRITIIVILMIVSSMIFIVSFTNLTNKANAINSVFSMIGIQSGAFQSSSLEDNIVTCTGLICAGTPDPNIMIGSSLNEEISGIEGDDAIQGNNGEDLIYGGDGDDTIQGGGGFDNIFGGEGNDYLFADSSTSLFGAIGDQISIVNRLNDKLLGIGIENLALDNKIKVNENDVADVFASLNSNMLLYPESHLDGGDGNDYLFGGSDNDVIAGGPGKDFFDCNEGIDSIIDFNPDEDTANVDCENL